MNPRESKIARLPGWEEENELGSDRLMTPQLLACIKRISEIIERLRARNHD